MLSLLHGGQLWVSPVLEHGPHYIFSQHHRIFEESLVQQGPVFHHRLPDVRIGIDPLF